MNNKQWRKAYCILRRIAFACTMIFLVIGIVALITMSMSLGAVALWTASGGILSVWFSDRCLERFEQTHPDYILDTDEGA